MGKLEDVKGIGPKSLALLNKMGIYTIDDLVTHYPFRYVYLERTDLTKAENDDHVIIDGKVESTPILMRFKAGLNKMNFRLVTAYGVVGVSIFNRAFMKKELEVGITVTVIGKFDKVKNVITASEIKFESLKDKVKIEPVYHLTNGISNKNINTFINMALLEFGKEITDYIPKKYQEKYNFQTKRMALNIVNNPPDKEKLDESIKRLKYEELFVFMFKINYLKNLKKNSNVGIEKKIDRDKVDNFINGLKFELTGDQKKAVNDILKDMESSYRMNRLLQGDVGSGKTIVSFIAMYANYLAGYQSALMAPTEILAVQHYNNLREILGEGFPVALLTGSTTKKEKDEIYKGLMDGSINMVVGTHALIQDDVKYNNLGLVITDEQHRFGVNQRGNLQNKGIKPDILYMSATPIPRTYALAIYGDMDTSIIKEKPKGRKKIKTYVKKKSEIKDVLTMMLEELKKKHQIYVIAPLIDGADDASSVTDLKDKMELAFGKYFNIDIIHGKMAGRAKDLIMREFEQNKIQILISTTVIEVGVDVPNATTMVIFDADKFGLSTLHQLRGRVGRGEDESKCILVSDSDTKRLSIMEKEDDGFKISEEDFKMRGHGDLFGTKQSGDMEFKLANLKNDYDLLIEAKKDTDEYLSDSTFDPLKLKLLSTLNSNS